MDFKSLIIELEAELGSTKNLLEIIPEDRLGWKPHEKAMTLGQLALHVATIPGNNLSIVDQGQITVKELVEHPIPADKAKILNGFSNSAKMAADILEKATLDWANQNWQLKNESGVIAQMPRSAFIRTFVFNHWYHHRGELMTYLRTLNVKLPSVYGPTADVNPFQ